MRTRSLGGHPIATVGLGDVSLARASDRGRDPAEVVRRVHEAIEAAIDVIDVAPEADTERMVGDTVRTLRARDRVIVATRVEPLGSRDTLLETMPIGYLVERIEAALRTTKLDALPLAQLPLRAGWRTSTAWPELRGTCQRLVHDGKVLRWGAIGDEPELAEESWLASISIVFSACTRASAAMFAAATATPVATTAPTDPFLAIAMESAPLDLLASIAALQAPRGGGLILPSAPPPAAAEAPPPVPRTITVFARQPLAGGALAGTIGPGVRFAPNDDRRALDPAQLEAIAVGVANLAIRTKREPPAARSSVAARALIETTRKPVNVVCTTVAELALRYVIDRGAVALPRIHRPDDLYELVLCGSADPLPPELIARIDELWPDPTA